MKKRAKFRWRDDIRVLPAMPLHIWLPHGPPDVSLEKVGDDYRFIFRQGEDPNLPIGEFLIGINVWRLREEFFQVQSPADALEFLSKFANFLDLAGEVSISSLGWSEFQRWQRLLIQISTNGFPIFHADNERCVLPYFFPGDTLLAAELRALFLSDDLSEATRDWLRGNARYVNISRNSERHMYRHPDDTPTSCSVITTTIVDSILATIYFSGVVGIKTRKCKRDDCNNVFEHTTNHEREYCGPKCAHTQGTRDRRAEARQKSTKAKPARTKTKGTGK